MEHLLPIISKTKVTLGWGKKQMWHQKTTLCCLVHLEGCYKLGFNWWDFQEDRPHTLQTLLSCADYILSPLLYQDCVSHYYSRLTMAYFIKKDTQFKNFPCAFYATDVIFQQGNRNLGSFLEGKLQFSGNTQIILLQNWSVCGPNRTSNQCYGP